MIGTGVPEDTPPHGGCVFGQSSADHFGLFKSSDSSSALPNHKLNMTAARIGDVFDSGFFLETLSFPLENPIICGKLGQIRQFQGFRDVPHAVGLNPTL